MNDAYNTLKSEVKLELFNILNYWAENTVDNEYGGFIGKRDHYNNLVEKASKGIILNTRILWSFSAASNHLKTNKYKALCDRAYNYLKTFFNDQKHKGLFWELNYKSEPINKRKQVYAQAFGIYALSEYYLLTQNEDVKNWAIELFELLEAYANDTTELGYLEAFNEDWSAIEDMRLSTKDMNAAKTMNTHLHVLEAYTALLKIYDNAQLRESLKTLIELFFNKFLNSGNHFDLFFDKQWKLLSNSVSYGHDIETIWLLIEAAKCVGDNYLIAQTKNIAIAVSNTFLVEAIDTDGAVLNEKNLTSGRIDTDKHWWPQMEALVGLQYAYNIKTEEKYITNSLKIWDFTKKHLLDHKNGEWHFRVDRKGKAYTNEDKVSMWKAPYHTSRACMLLND